MKNPLLTLQFLFFFTLVLKGQSWIELPNLPFPPAFGSVAFTLNNELYVGAGDPNDGSREINNYFRLDERLNEWIEIDSLSFGEEASDGLAVYNDTIAIIAGGSNSTIKRNDCWKYDYRTNEWERLTMIPWGGRSRALGGIVNDKMYVMGGSPYDMEFAFHNWEYDLNSNVWNRKSDVPVYTVAASSAIVDEDIYLLFCQGIEPGTFYTDFWIYDTNRDNWRNGSTFPGGFRLNATIGGHLGKIYVVGGSKAGVGMMKDVWTYDITGDFWQQLEDLPIIEGGVGNGNLVSIGNSIYFTAGMDLDGDHSNRTFKYTPNLNLAVKEGSIRIEDYYLVNDNTINLKEGVKKVRIYNLSGKLVKTFTTSIRLDSGIYILDLELNSGKRTHKKVLIH